MTNILSKIFKKNVYSRMYNTISNYISPFQAGFQKNRGTNDIFLLRGTIDHSLYSNSPLFYDFQQCFDSIWFQDSMLCLWNAGIQDELFYLVYKLTCKNQSFYSI